MLGAFGSSLLFICALLVGTVLTASVLAYTAHYFLVVVADTAAGVDKVRWPADLIVDWIGQSLRLFALVGVLLVPVGLLTPIIGRLLPPDYAGLEMAVAVVAWLWLVFPVGLLSSMSVGSVFAVVRPAVVVALMRRWPAVILFYAVTAVGFLGVVVAWAAALAGQLLLLPVACLGSAWGLLVYARLIGRLGWLAERARPSPRKRPAGKLKPSLRKQIEVSDPWAGPAAETPKPEAKKNKRSGTKRAGGYGISDEPLTGVPKFKLIEGSPFLDVHVGPQATPEADRPLSPRRYLEEGDDGKEYGVAPEEAPSPEARPHLDVTPSALDMRLAESAEDTFVPDHPLFSGVYTFPFYVTSLWIFSKLCLYWLVLGFWLQLLIGRLPG